MGAHNDTRVTRVRTMVCNDGHSCMIIAPFPGFWPITEQGCVCKGRPVGPACNRLLCNRAGENRTKWSNSRCRVERWVRNGRNEKKEGFNFSEFRSRALPWPARRRCRGSPYHRSHRPRLWKHPCPSPTVHAGRQIRQFCQHRVQAGGPRQRSCRAKEVWNETHHSISVDDGLQSMGNRQNRDIGSEFATKGVLNDTVRFMINRGCG